MVTAMILARVRTLQENGTYSQLVLIINLMSSILMLGLPNSINYFLAKANTVEETNQFLSVYYTLSSILSALVGVTLVCLMPTWENYFSNPQIAEFGFFLLICPWTRIICSSAENVLVVLKKTKMLMLYRMFNSVAVLITILSVWISGQSFRVYMIIYIAVESLFAILVYKLVSTYTGVLSFRLNKALIKRIFEFSIPIGLAGIVGTLNIEIDKLLIGRMFSTEVLAVYTYASKEMPVTIIATSLTAVIMPRMVRLFDQGLQDAAIQMWKKVITLSFAVISYLSIGLAVFSKEALTFLYSEQYASGYGVFAVYSICLLTKCTYFGMVLNAKGATRQILFCSVGTLVLNVILNTLLYGYIGFIGPALATLVSAVSMQMLQLMLSARLLDIRFLDIFPWRNIAILSVINLFLAGIGIIILHIVGRSVLSAMLYAVVWGIVYLLLLKNWLYECWRYMNMTE